MILPSGRVWRKSSGFWSSSTASFKLPPKKSILGVVLAVKVASSGEIWRTSENKLSSSARESLGSRPRIARYFIF